MYFKKLELNWHIKFANYPNGTIKNIFKSEIKSIYIGKLYN